VRHEFRAGFGHGIVRPGGLGMPVRVDDRFDVAGQLEDVLRVRGIAAIDQKIAAVSGQRDDVISRAGNQRDFIRELRDCGGCLSESPPGEAKRCARGREGAEKFTSLLVHCGPSIVTLAGSGNGAPQPAGGIRPDVFLMDRWPSHCLQQFAYGIRSAL
jgi:hypothetical protein